MVLSILRCNYLIIEIGGFMIKALALDIDGTITDKNRIGCISAIDTIHKVENIGIPVINNYGQYFMFH